MTCKGSDGCFDSKSNALEKAIRLQGANDGVLSLMKNDPNVKITQVWSLHHVKELSQQEIYVSWTDVRDDSNRLGGRAVGQSGGPSVRRFVRPLV